MADERDLVVRLQAGDEAAFAELVRAYQARLLRLAESVVSSRPVAEEVVQDTWLAVVRGVDRFEGRSSLKTWLFHILLNRARLEEHLAACPHCSEYLAQLRVVIDASGRVEPDDLDDDTLDELVALYRAWTRD